MINKIQISRMLKGILVIAFFLLCELSNAQQAQKNNNSMAVGVARVDISPVGPVRLTGYAARGKEESTKVLSGLSAKALAFGTGPKQTSLLITVDLVGINWRVTKQVVDRLSKETALNPAQIAICASHTHGSPEVGNLINILQCRGDYPSNFNFSDSLINLDQLLHIAQFSERLTDKLVEVALAALNNRKPALVAWGQGEASFAVNRRPEGGPVDHTLPVLRVTDLDGNVKAIFVNYACHGITLGPEVNEAHGDWMGEVQHQLETKYSGAIAMVSAGCGGDAHPGKQGKMEYVRAHGEEIANNVEQLFKSKLKPLNSAPVGRMKWIRLPFSKVPTVAELMKMTEDKTVKGYYARLALERVIRGEKLPKSLDYPVQVWNFDDKLLMLNMGGELVVDYSIRLKRELGADRVWINAYANDVSCYIPSRRILKEGGYEADASMYWYNMPAPFSEAVEDIVVNAVLELVPASFKKGSAAVKH
ncbi:hypothetical protein [Pedobacter heparinus]|uniref:hypothetical protein n=1 Tax=Pedobacter heparinus TaxID=984 RepID=UPI00292F8E71|nr:hypothetical protein [Pedobacter heparinus]